MASEGDGSNEITKSESAITAITDGDGASSRGADRKNLVAAATVFLNSKKIKDSPAHLKRAFLERKGLTSEEINTAFTLADSFATQAPQHLHSIPVANEESFFKKARNFVISTIAFTGTALAIFEVFQRYISPWLMRDGKDWQERLLEGQSEVNENIASLVSTIDDLRKQVAESDDGKVKNSHHDALVVTEIKEELKSLKSMMLNRHQFPSLPTSRPTLPSWQLDAKRGSCRADLHVDHKEQFERTNHNCISVEIESERCNGAADDVGDEVEENDQVEMVDAV